MDQETYIQTFNLFKNIRLEWRDSTIELFVEYVVL